MSGWVAGSNGNKANSASIEVEIELRLSFSNFFSGLGWVAGLLDQMKIKLTSASLAWAWAELGNKQE